MHEYLLFIIIGCVALVCGILVSLLLNRGTKFRIIKNGFAFGFKRYTFTDSTGYSFSVEKNKFTYHDLPPYVRQTPSTWKGVWAVHVKVYHNKEFLRMHVVKVRNEHEADDMVSSINEEIKRMVGGSGML